MEKDARSAERYDGRSRKLFLTAHPEGRFYSSLHRGEWAVTGAVQGKGMVKIDFACQAEGNGRAWKGRLGIAPISVLVVILARRLAT